MCGQAIAWGRDPCGGTSQSMRLWCVHRSVCVCVQGALGADVLDLVEEYEANKEAHADLLRLMGR